MGQIIDALTRPTPRTLYSVGGEKLYEDQSARNDSEFIRNALAAGISLKSAKLMGLSLKDVNFDGLDLSGADLQFSTFVGCTFRAANMQGAKFKKTDLLNCDFTKAVLTDINGFLATTIDGCVFASARIFMADQTIDAVITDSDFSGAAIDGTFYSCRLARVDMSQVTGAITFEESTLYSVDFRGAEFVHGRFSWSTFDGCDFRGATTTEADEEIEFDDIEVRNCVGLEDIGYPVSQTHSA